MVRILYVLTLLAAIVAALVLFWGFTLANSAPQEAASAALAIGLAVIPYVFTRCVQLSHDYSERRRTDERLIALLEEANRLARDQIKP